MTPTLTTLLASLALVGPPTLDLQEAGPESRGSAPPAALSGPKVLPPFGLVPPGSPALRADQPVRCLYGPSGAFRAQCDDRARRCLVAQDAMLDAEGRPSGPLEQAGACLAPAIREADLAGWTLVPALADTPPGYRRDERQRATQVSFDLGRRLWLGFGAAVGGQPWQPGALASSGLRLDVPFTWGEARALGRVRALEGFTAVDGSAAELSAVSVDFSRAYPHPLLRLTTFFGTPRRYDPPLYVGLWAEALRFESLRTRAGGRHERTGALAAALTFDFWRSADFGSFLRARTGGGWEKASGRDDGDWAVHWLVEGEVALDEDGLSHLRGAAGSELVLPAGDGPAAPLPDRRWRHQARLEWERILVSVNDQPVSLVVLGRASRRTDVPDWPDGWTAEATAQLRVNLWAPPRRSAGAVAPGLTPAAVPALAPAASDASRAEPPPAQAAPAAPAAPPPPGSPERP
ncbi:MAG: hypothetical protein IPO09_13925 [Anaeromyxobacter sp.]|nr:hypothetical protein [Anaeromyxobacter sp.]MBL0275285.1 hypothetical protein [Anaeromyxobacter sp.]